MNFTKILYRRFGPFIDLRFMNGEEKISELRVLGELPGQPTVIDWLYKTFDYPDVEVCCCDQEDFIPIPDEKGQVVNAQV